MQSKEVEPTNILHDIHHTKDGDTGHQCNSFQECGFQLSELVLILRDPSIDISERIFCCSNP